VQVSSPLSWIAIPNLPPARLPRQSALRRALAKDPDERWQSARDLAGVLELAGAASASENARPATRIPAWALVGFAALALASIAAAFWFSQRKPEERFWTGESLGGPAQALGPRVSPDGQTIAFQAMVDGQAQVAVMKPQSGNWAVLTHQKDLGQIRDIAWSSDGSKLYFDRAADIPRGIFSVPMLGGEPRMVLEAASVPCVLADGSLLVHRINARRDTQIYRYWPESGKMDPLPALADDTFGSASRAMPDGKAVVFFGNPLTGNGDEGPPDVYTLDLESRKVVNVAPRQIFNRRHLGMALAVTPTANRLSTARSAAD
jgi:eukaryotic-like serine/threonine-protein kinase